MLLTSQENILSCFSSIFWAHSLFTYVAADLITKPCSFAHPLLPNIPREASLSVQKYKTSLLPPNNIIPQEKTKCWIQIWVFVSLFALAQCVHQHVDVELVTWNCFCASCFTKSTCWGQSSTCILVRPTPTNVSEHGWLEIGVFGAGPIGGKDEESNWKR